MGRDPFNQNFRKFRSKTQWIGSVQPEKFRKNGSTFLGGPLFPVEPVGILVEWIAPMNSHQKNTGTFTQRENRLQYNPLKGHKSAHKPHRRDVTHILCKESRFLLKSFHFLGYGNDRFFLHTNPYISTVTQQCRCPPMLIFRAWATCDYWDLFRSSE